VDNIQSLNIFVVYNFPSDAVVRRKKHGQLFLYYGCIYNVNFHEHVSVKYSLKICIKKFHYNWSGYWEQQHYTVKQLKTCNVAAKGSL